MRGSAVRSGGSISTRKRKPARASLPEPVFLCVASLSRALAPVVAAEAEAAEPDRCPSPGSPSHPGTSASQEAAEAAEAEVAEVAAEAEAAQRRSSTTGSPADCANASGPLGRTRSL